MNDTPTILPQPALQPYNNASDSPHLIPCHELAMSDFVTVAKVGAIAPGEGQAFAVHGRMVAVFNVDGTYQAIDDFCPHMGASLAGGYVENGMVSCPWHA
ncbi:MAG TPA: Rieske 2Fe-2S domain-containing protein, partial [Pirellulaceae bacterium]|nr:Rieske 2Fe-2S domain-containing protein [Pirellulaceae bacterium]